MDNQHMIIVMGYNHRITKIRYVSIRIEHRTAAEQAIIPTIAMVFNQQTVFFVWQQKV